MNALDSRGGGRKRTRDVLVVTLVSGASVNSADFRTNAIMVRGAGPRTRRPSRVASEMPLQASESTWPHEVEANASITIVATLSELRHTLLIIRGWSAGPTDGHGLLGGLPIPSWRAPGRRVDERRRVYGWSYHVATNLGRWAESELG